MLPALGERTTRVAWPHAPRLRATTGSYFPTAPGLVRLVQLGGRVRWAYEVENAEGLTGEPAQARAWGEFVLIAVRRNHGVEIDRVGAADGKSAWAEPAFADADRIDLFSTDADAERVYVPAARQTLLAARRFPYRQNRLADRPAGHARRARVGGSGREIVRDRLPGGSAIPRGAAEAWSGSAS